MITEQDLRKAREESPNVVYQTFEKLLADGKDGVFCFYEGKDAPYYNYRFAQFMPNVQTHPLRCHGKKMVLKVYSLIKYHREYDAYRTAFFIDRDFDFPINADLRQHIYETPCYSVENFYVQTSVMAKIANIELGFTEVDESFKNLMTAFDRLLTENVDAQKIFNAWYCCLKEKKNSERLYSTGISLSSKFPRGYVAFSLEGVKRTYIYQRIIADNPTAIPIDMATVANKLDEWRRGDLMCVSRGKYLVEFLVKFIKCIVVDSNTQQGIVKEKRKYNVEFDQVVSMYSQYATTPTCLISYLTTLN